jgi:hypothetical protein
VGDLTDFVTTSELEVNMLRNKTPLFLILLIVVGILVYAVGCGDTENTLSNTSFYSHTPGPPPSLDGVNILSRAKYSEGHNLFPNGDEPYYTSEIIGSDGGEVSLADIVIEVKKDGISKDKDEEIEVSISVPDPSLFVFDLGPEGFRFHKKVKIKVYLDNADLNGIDPDDIEYIWWDEEEEEWVSEGGKYKEKENYVEVKTDHFSYWALASD